MKMRGHREKKICKQTQKVSGLQVEEFMSTGLSSQQGVLCNGQGSMKKRL